ncbi:MAG: adenylate/guanylate cyclase domain-containing response regulator [Myxococcales bacterium]|nr:adenylate/guanylate cyclase domain-containing response regulator [Myxococcales bacterium]
MRPKRGIAGASATCRSRLAVASSRLADRFGNFGAVTIPASPFDSGAFSGYDTLVSGRGVREIVLAVDDVPRNLDVIEAALAREDWELRCATNGPDALRMVDDAVPDVILLDVMMPGMDGIEVCRQLKSKSHTRTIPVVLVTALDSPEDRVRGLDAGADDFVTKPFHPSELRARIRAHLRVRALQRSLQARESLLRTLFARYVSDDVAQALLRDPQLAGLGVKRSRLTVLFADLRGFTSVSESSPPEEVVQILNQTFLALTEALFRHGGTFDKFIGDCLMAFFGAPLASSDDTVRCVRAAVDMQAAFGEVLRGWADTPFAGLGLGIGIHVGDAVVGNVGTERLMDYTAIGDSVNLAARLEEIAARGETLISGDAAKELGDTFELTDLGVRVVKGRAQGVQVFRVGVAK